VLEEIRGRACHIVAVGGKSEMIRPVIIAQGLGIPVFAVADADGDQVANPDRRTRHHRDNLALIRLFEGNENETFPIVTYWLERIVMWPANLADAVKREFIEALGVQGAERFEQMRTRALQECGNAGDLDKNSVYIGTLLELLKEAGVTSRSLDQLCDQIVAFGG
jgi:putative ATP-dependent endonuclease of OLD family